MDTKVEQEVFGYDPADPSGLDKVHDHIHTAFEELELRLAAQTATDGRLADEASRELAEFTGSPEERDAIKQATYLARYGNAGRIQQGEQVIIAAGKSHGIIRGTTAPQNWPKLP